MVRLFKTNIEYDLSDLRISLNALTFSAVMDRRVVKCTRLKSDLINSES